MGGRPAVTGGPGRRPCWRRASTRSCCCARCSTPQSTSRSGGTRTSPRRRRPRARCAGSDTSGPWAPRGSRTGSSCCGVPTRKPRVRFLDLRAEPSSPTAQRLGGWLDRTRDASRRNPVAQQRLLVAPDVRLVEESAAGDGGLGGAEPALVSARALPETLRVDAVTAALLAGCDGGCPRPRWPSCSPPPRRWIPPRCSASPPSCSRPATSSRLPERAVDQTGLIPQASSTDVPGSRRISPSPVASALGGQVIGSTASPRRRRSGASVSPVKTCR